MRTPRAFSTSASWILVCIAGIAFLGSAAVPAAVAATVETSAEGTLSIDTDPAGALAYLDGEPQGLTPVSVGGLPPGDHRIRVVKDGYLENSRVANVRAGQESSVQVRLTTVSSSSPGPVLLEGSGQGKAGGGSKKWIWIRLGFR